MSRRMNRENNRSDLSPAAASVAVPGDILATARRARVAGSFHFLANGVGFGLWAALIPTLKHRLDLSDLQLSGVLLGMVLGALTAMPIVGRILPRRGSHKTLSFITPLYCFAPLLPIIAPTHATVIIAAVIFGALKGAFDVSVNTQAISIEGVLERPINGSFQALWSIGGLLAALLTGFALRQGVSPWLLASGTSLALVCVPLTCSRHLLPDARETAPDQDSSPARFRMPSPTLLRIGALSFAALFSEGVMMDWGAVYTRNIGGAPEWLAPIAYGVFCCSMAGARLLGDWLIAWVGAPMVLRISGCAMTAGLATMIAIQHWPATFVGLGLAGIGMGSLVPIFFRAGGRAHPEGIGRGIATVSMIGYIGFLAGPPAIGAMSELFGLPGAFGLVALFAAVITFAGPLVLRPSSSSSFTPKTANSADNRLTTHA